MEEKQEAVFVRPKILISKCLEHDTCRYDGEVIKHAFIRKMIQFVDFYTICPEVEIGMGIPRDPVRIVLVNGKKELFQPVTEVYLTEKMNTFCVNAISGLEDLDGFILKNRSPSCGINDVKIFLGTKKSAGSKRGAGFWGEMVQKRFSGYPMEDEGRLNNFFLREHFLTSIYVWARARMAKQRQSFKALLQFHRVHKLLFMAYNQAGAKRLGAICGNHKRIETAKVWDLYFEEVRKILAKPPKFTSMINALMHAYGGVSKGLSPVERNFFLRTLEEYRDERIPLSTVLHLIQGWALRFHNDYLGEQVLLSPFPSDLVDLTNTGKKRF